MSNENFLHRHLESQIRSDMEKAELSMDKNFYLFMLDINSKIDSLAKQQKDFIESIESNPTVKLGSLFVRYPKLMAVILPLTAIGFIYISIAKNSDVIKTLLGL